MAKVAKDKEALFVQAGEELSASRDKPVYIVKLEQMAREDCVELEQHLSGMHLETIDVVVHSPGGDISAAYHMVRILRRHADHVTVIVPEWAKSAATRCCRN